MASTVADERRRVGLTQEQFVAAFNLLADLMSLRAAVGVRQVRRWESSAPPLPHAAQQQVLEAFFGLPLHELGFTVPFHRRTRPGPMSQDGRVLRREFVAALGGLGAATALAAPPGGRVGTADLNALHDGVEELYRLDHTGGGTLARAHGNTLVRRAQDLLTHGRYLERVGQDLLALSGQLHCHLGWIDHDAGRAASARTHALEALAAARLTGDTALEIRALSTLSLLGVAQRRPREAVAAAATAADLARQHAGAGARLVLALRTSRAALATGDLTGSRHALAQAIAHHERASEEPDPPRWTRFAGPVEIDYATAAHYLAASQPAAAVPYLQAAVRALPDGYARNQVLYRARLAQILLQADEADAASAEATTLAAQAAGLASARCTSRLRQLEHALAAHPSTTAHQAAALLHDAIPTRSSR